MTPEQSECTALLKLGDDGVWYCPKCGLKLLLPLKPPWPGSRRNGPRLSSVECPAQDCADRSGPYSNPID